MVEEVEKIEDVEDAEEVEVTEHTEMLARLSVRASPEASRLALSVLEADIAGRTWSDQVGPSLSQKDTARLLDRSEQAVSKDRRLLRVRRRDGSPVYPIVQFEGRAQRPGVAEIIEVLSPALGAPAIASWLTAPNDQLAEMRPIEALSCGMAEQTTALATRLADRLSH
ncbi:MAG: hypothetical protein M0T80_09325 [Actinomycetota bacterium]|nr:hypothetical protein [Actinomycetota bacterium]